MKSMAERPFFLIAPMEVMTASAEGARKSPDADEGYRKGETPATRNR